MTYTRFTADYTAHYFYDSTYVTFDEFTDFDILLSRIYGALFS